jgi:hypothetical protein
MRLYKPVLAVVVALLLLSTAHALEPCGDASLACVRIKSHGVSGTVIATTEGKSWVLGCCHMFMDPWNSKVSKELLALPLVIEGPVQPYAPQKKSGAHVIAYDEDSDLSLVEVDNGPFFYVPVGKKGHKPSKNLLSLGFDSMAWPVTQDKATILFSFGGKTHTEERPWHGRSGGGLIDVDNRCLIGVVWGYETRKGGHGLYVQHDLVVSFVEKHLPRHTSPQKPIPVPIQKYSEAPP